MTALARHRTALSGVLFLLLVVGLVGLCVGTFRKAMPWQQAASVRIVTASPGLGLGPHADVKLQGMLVGEVRSVESNGRTATIMLAIEPEQLELLPANVDAVIAPKTLFGEKFVDLVIPERPAPDRLANGDTIARSETSVELGRIFARLEPLLVAADPADLSAVLTSLAQALDGRGEQIARTLGDVDQFLRILRPELGALLGDLDLLAEVADDYAALSPDFGRFLAASSRISRDVLVAHEETLERFLDGGIVASDAATRLLRQTADQLVQLVRTAEPVLDLLHTYSPGLACFIQGLRTGEILGNQAAGARGPFTDLTNDLLVDRDAYTYPDDLVSAPESDANLNRLPKAVPSWAPHCPEFSAEALALDDVAPYTFVDGHLPVDPRQADVPDWVQDLIDRDVS